MKKEIAGNLSQRKNERGNVLAFTVISALFLFLAVGLGADLSHLYLVKTELQNAADSAALAGASALLMPKEQRIPTAMQRALDTLNKNRYNFSSEQFEDAMERAEQGTLVTFAVNLDGEYVNAATAANMDNIRFVKVDTPTVNVNIFFSIPILGFARNMTATATAGLSRENNVFCDFIPIAVIEGPFGGGLGWMDFDGNGTKDYATDCSPPEDSPVCNPNTTFCPGCRYKMIAAPGGWDDTSPGNYQALDAGSGGSALKLAIAGGSTKCLTVGDDAVLNSDTEPGRKAGAIEKGLNTRFDDYQGFGPGTVTVAGVPKPIEEAFPPDLNIFDNAPPGRNPPPYPGISYDTYQKATESPAVNWQSPNHTAAPHRREVLMPIINSDQFDPGKDNVEFTKFGKFFLNRRVGKIPNNAEIYVEFLEPAFGAGGFDPTGGPAAPIVVPVLYR